MADPLTSACTIVDALAALQVDVLTRINKKFAALQNLANLLEQLADPSSLIPNLAGLIPVANIDLSTYNALVANCPYLNLPPATDQLQSLQSAVTLAYTNLFKKLANSPQNRLGSIQQQMYDFQAKINNGMGEVSQFLQCLQTVCAAGRSAVGLLSSISDTNVKKQITAFAEGYAARAGKVLSDTAQFKYQQTKDVMNQLSALGADAGKDYSTAKAALASKTVTA